MGYPGLFRPEGKQCVTQLRRSEVAILRRVFTETATLVGDPGGSDPVLARLFPDAYAEDSDAADEFRRLTEQDLSAEKAHQVGVVLGSLPERGGELRLDPEDAQAWLRALTDARLALGHRLGVDDDTELSEEIDDAAMRDPTGVRALQLSVYGYLTYMQESLVESLMGTT
ncbi:MAG: DUF2017 domain-containing protein [Micromonosporaceae bacterium]